MSNYIELRWFKVKDPGNTPNGYYYDSNLIQLNGPADIQIQTTERSIDLTYLLSLNGERFVSFKQDYFAELHISHIPIIGVGQILKFRVNKLPDLGLIIGNVDDMGDINPDEPEDIVNAFAGSEGEYFRDINGRLFIGK